MTLAEKLTGVPVKNTSGDQGYSGNPNRSFCSEKGIETSFPQKEPKTRNEVKNTVKRERARVRDTAMKGSFGTQREHYGEIARFFNIPPSDLSGLKGSIMA